MRYGLAVAGLSLLVVACDAQPYPTVGSIEIVHPDLKYVVDADAPIEVIAGGFDWTEGPVWIPAGGYLLFSNIPGNEIFRWAEGDSAARWLRPSGYTGTQERYRGGGSNGLLLDADGRLVLAQHGDRRMARMDSPVSDPTPTFVTLAASLNGARFNSPNDATYRSDGTLWFTDPPYGLHDAGAASEKEIAFNGVYVLELDGSIRVVTNSLSRPNGIAFSPDGATLYVANSHAEQAVWMAYPIDESGTVGEGWLFHDATDFVGTDAGLPDGLKVDRDGRLYATGPGGVWVFTPDGTVLGRIKTGQATSNVAFGGADGRTLYMTADDYVMRVRLRTTGMGF